MTSGPHGPAPDTRASLAAALDAALARAVGGRASVVVVEGAAGLGRTTVLRDLADRTRLRHPGAGVLEVRAVAWEADRALAVLDQLVPGAVLGPDDTDDTDDTDVFALARAVAGSLPPGPVLVLLDDADRADPLSLQVLATDVRHHRDRPWLVVLSRDPGRAGESGRATHLLADVADERLVVAPLTATEVAEVAEAAGVALHPSLAEHLTRHTAGRPDRVAALLASEPRETWRGAAPPLPATAPVLEETRLALADLDDLADRGRGARDLVEALAVLGSVPVRVAAAVAGLDGLAGPDDVLDDVTRAIASGLVRRREGPTATELAPSGPMTAAAVRTLMGPAREAALHGRASEHVEDDARRLLHAVAARVAPDRGLAERLHTLATERAGRGAWASAAELYSVASRTSVDPDDREERLLLAVDALVGAGDLPAATSYLPEIEGLRETAMRNAVLGYVAILRGRAPEAESRLTRAWRLTNGDRHPAVAATIAQRHVLHHLARCSGGELVSWADEAVTLVGADHPTAVEAQAIRGLGLGSTGHLGEALASYRALRGHASEGAVGQRVQMGEGWLRLAADEVDLARAELTSAAPTDVLGGSTRISLWARAWLARTHFVSGEWDQALQVAEPAAVLAERSGMALLVPLLRWTVTQVHALRGDWDAALDSTRTTAPTHYEVMRVPGCLARAALAEARADYAGVVAALTPLTRADVSPDVAEPGFWPWPDVFANALVVEGRLQEAGVFLDEHERRAADREHRSAQARLGYARGRLLGATGDLARARRTFERSLELLEGLPLVYDRARVTFAYGQTLRRAGKRREADAVIVAAREDWAALGATTYVRRCDRELRAGGVNGVLRDRPADGLTPQEQAVAALVAQGMTNREAAAELFLSVKTVQFHLTRVYAKLGVRSRSELAGLPADALDAPAAGQGGAS